MKVITSILIKLIQIMIFNLIQFYYYRTNVEVERHTITVLSPQARPLPQTVLLNDILLVYVLLFHLTACYLYNTFIYRRI